MESQQQQQQQQAFELEEKRVPKSRTKKSRIHMSKTEKAKLWEILDTEVEPRKLTIEYNTDTTICKLCSADLISNDDGFPTCVNSACGLICRDYTRETFSAPKCLYGLRGRHPR